MLCGSIILEGLIKGFFILHNLQKFMQRMLTEMFFVMTLTEKMVALELLHKVTFMLNLQMKIKLDGHFSQLKRALFDYSPT